MKSLGVENPKRPLNHERGTKNYDWVSFLRKPRALHESNYSFQVCRCPCDVGDGFGVDRFRYLAGMAWRN
jgi:hypothetical protein